MIVSGFAGVGKSTLSSNSDLFIDLESSNFKWIIPEEQKLMSVEERKGLPKEQNPNWPENYLKEMIILSNAGRIVLISMDKFIRDELEARKAKFILVYPDKSIKDEYIERLIKRGNNEKFVELIKVNYDQWIEDLNKTKQLKIVLYAGMYISDVKNTIEWYEEHKEYIKQ